MLFKGATSCRPLSHGACSFGDICIKVLEARFAGRFSTTPSWGIPLGQFEGVANAGTLYAIKTNLICSSYYGSKRIDI